MPKKFLTIILVAVLLQFCTHRATTGKSPQPVADTTVASNPVSLTGAARRAEVLFLGNTSKHHDSQKFAPWLAIALFKKGINLTYTNELTDINPENLSRYDGLIIYANYDSLPLLQEQAMKTFVESGKGLIPLHAASGCFKNSDWYIQTVGGQFASHGTGVFSGTVVNSNHPVTKDITAFSTWDETYVHQRLNPDMTVLMERDSNGKKGPYTWVRNQGKGRVFYTAYGHNDSTWTNLGFLRMVENGVLWALGDNVGQQIANLHIPDVDIYNPDTISHYTRRHLVTRMQDALSPEESLKLTQVPVDFEMKLFAAEPDITNPIAMSWDERGRLWIVESVDYPNTFLETDGAANDRIKICEDTDGDGKADKFTVFADKLNIPTSMVFANGGVVVSMAPYFLFLKDTDGDDKADVREEIMKGWDKNDTHFGPSNLQYGFDNKIWGVVGSGFNGTTSDGKTQNFRTGVYHVNPDGTGFEFLANTSNNTWGLGFSEDNNVFISTANNTHSAFYSMPAKLLQRPLAGNLVLPVQKIDGHYESHTLTPNLRQVDVVGGFTSAAGHHLYTARSFPKEYWNRIAFVCEPTVRLIHNAIIEPDGAGFKEKDGWNLLASSDEWAGPVQTEVGPDGAVWVADWYNFIIQHNVFVEQQAPSNMVLPFKDQPRGQGNAFVSPLRDISFGRIYRIVYKKAPAYTPVKLSRDDRPGLVAALKNDNMFWRMTAQRLLVETKDLSTVPALTALVNDQAMDAIGLNNSAVHAIWTLKGMGALEKNAEALQAVNKALMHPAAGVRKAALEVMAPDESSLKKILSAGLIQDKNLNVRMKAIVALAVMPASVEIGRLIYGASVDSTNSKDPWLTKALLAAAITHQEGYMAAYLEDSAANGAATGQALSGRIANAVSHEIYPLQRRSSSSFPPDVSGKEIIVKGTISRQDTITLQGLLVAQGGSTGGYGIYIQDGRLNMVVKQAGKVYKAVSTGTLPETFDLVAKLAKNGLMTLVVDGKLVGKAKAPSLFTQPLDQTLRSGTDLNNENRMGSYEGPFPFTGSLQNGSLELKKNNPAGTMPVRRK